MHSDIESSIFKARTYIAETMEPTLQIDEPNLQELVKKLLSSGRTQKAIADRLGCSQAHISEIAAGKASKTKPSYRLVRGLEMLVEEASAA